MLAARLLVLLFLLAPLHAQELKLIDLTTIQQRTELRHPPAPPPQCDADGCTMSGGIGGSSIGCGAPDSRDPRVLRIELLRVTPTEIDPTEPFEAEFQLTNTGKVAMDLPVSPHLSDLQPKDESLNFTYYSLALIVTLNVDPYGGQMGLGFVELYGSPDHDGTMATVQPGEWIRVKAKIKLNTWPSQRGAANAYGSMWFRKNTFHPYPGSSSLEIQNLYPNVTQMGREKWLPVYLKGEDEEPK